MRPKYRWLLLILIFLVGFHLISSQSGQPRNNLTSILDNSLNSQSIKDKFKRPIPGKQLNNPINENPDSGGWFNSKGRLAQIRPLSRSKLKKIKDYTIFFDKLEKFAIKQPSIKDKYKTEKAHEMFSTHVTHMLNKEYLENVLDISDATFKELKDSHYRYVHEQIPKLINDYGIKTFGNILPSDKEWKNYHGSSGYVLVGGGQYTWLSYLVIKQLRATGAALPIELFIPSSSEVDKEFCDKVLPKFNARCNVFDSYLSANLKKRFDIGGYQYKMLAILSSKFENVLYLDSDNFPARDPDYLFESDIYKKNQLLLWPDAWARTTNPKFYEIAEVKVKPNKLRYSDYDKFVAGGPDKLKPLSQYTFKDSWFHDFENALPDPTSETGMLMVNKTSHLKTLLLCLYYNVFGPNYYYPLLTQGSAGEGDKETFIAAAHVMNEPWHQTLKQFKWTGYYRKVDGKFSSKALAHYDPIQAAQDPESEDVEVLFMHLSYPKFYPNWLVDNKDLIYEDGEHIRMYSQINDNVGYDFDLRVLQFFTEGLCANYYDESGKAIDGTPNVSFQENYMGKYLVYVAQDYDINAERCKNVFIPHLQWLKATKGKRYLHDIYKVVEEGQ